MGEERGRFYVVERGGEWWRGEGGRRIAVERGYVVERGVVERGVSGGERVEWWMISGGSWGGPGNCFDGRPRTFHHFPI